MKLEKIDHICFAVKNLAVECMESTASDGQVARFIENKGEGVFLISYKVDNLVKAMEELKQKGIQLIDSRPRVLFGNRYAFVHHPHKLNGVLTELLEGDFDINKQ